MKPLAKNHIADTIHHMPVIDHPIHEKVIEKQGAKYGCFNRKPYSQGYLAPNRVYAPSGNFTMENAFVPHVMSNDCRYDMSLTDRKCEGCEHRGSGEAYDQSVRGMASGN